VLRDEGRVVVLQGQLRLRRLVQSVAGKPGANVVNINFGEKKIGDFLETECYDNFILN
jgi:hypothetical protein